MNSSFVSLLHRCLPTLLLSLAFVFLTGASTSLLAHTCTSGAGLIIESALLLDRSFLLQGETLAGKVTYRNAGCTSLKLKRLVITARRPGSTHAGGPYDDFAPAKVPAAGYTTFTIKSGQAITLSASRAFTGQDPFGKWVAYSTYQDAAGAWHDSADVPFTLAVPTPVALAMCVNGSEDALPSGAFELPATQALQLQSALDQHKTVRLEPGKNYRTSVGFITLRSGQRLFGLNNDVPKIVVEPGAQGAVLSGLNHQGLEFPTSTAITRRNCFTRLDGPLSMVGARLEENVFVGLVRAVLTIDTRAGGYWRNNRIIRWMSHTSESPAVIQGDAARNSFGNVLLWSNILLPNGSPWGPLDPSKGFYAADQGDLTLIGTDMESWHLRGIQSARAGYTFEGGGTLRLLRPTAYSNVSNSTGHLDVAMDELQLYGWELFSSLPTPPQIRLRASNQRLIAVDTSAASGVKGVGWSVQDDAVGVFRFSTFDDRVAAATIGGAPVSGALPAADQATLMGFFAPARTGAPWERPILRDIPDPAGSAWNVDLATKPDHTAYLQSLIDLQGIARVPAGIYYITQPLLLKNGQGLVGAGAARTVIIAKGDFDLIRGGQQISIPAATDFVLADLTLQGGKNGIHHDKLGSGDGAQYTVITLSHVTFRDMSNAGIFIDGIYGWDNNLIDEVNFMRCKAGLMQRVPVWTPEMGDTVGMAYLDKNVFYRTQFVESSIALDMLGQRLSATNHFINSSFRDNGQVAFLANWSSTVFANSDFVNNGGAPTLNQNYSIYTGGPYVVAGRFQAGARGLSMLGQGSTCEGCTFELGGSTSATVVSAGAHAFFYNSASKDMPLGSLASGFSVNSAWPLDAMLNQKAVLLTPISGTPTPPPQVTTLVPGAPMPAPQLLFGVPWY